MSDFCNNSQTLNKLMQTYQKTKNKESLEDARKIIEINDKYIQSNKVSSDKLLNYNIERRQCMNAFALQHIEALRRKNALMQIEEDAEHLVSLNEYIKILIEEKSEPIDFLVNNFEYSEINIEQGNINLRRYKNRLTNFKTLKFVFKIFLLGTFLFFFVKIIKTIVY